MTNVERRRARRREILDAFSFFVSIPKKGPHKLKVHDISDLGLRFDFDDDGESPDDFIAHVGDPLTVHLYLNQSLYLPLETKIARIDKKNDKRVVGVETASSNLKIQQALTSLLQLVDLISETGQLA